VDAYARRSEPWCRPDRRKSRWRGVPGLRREQTGARARPRVQSTGSPRPPGWVGGRAGRTAESCGCAGGRSRLGARPLWTSPLLPCAGRLAVVRSAYEGMTIIGGNSRSIRPGGRMIAETGTWRPNRGCCRIATAAALASSCAFHGTLSQAAELMRHRTVAHGPGPRRLSGGDQQYPCRWPRTPAEMASSAVRSSVEQRSVPSRPRPAPGHMISTTVMHPVERSHRLRRGAPTWARGGIGRRTASTIRQPSPGKGAGTRSGSRAGEGHVRDTAR
jgi:hypothetical protein